MSRRPARCTKADLRRAIEAAEGRAAVEVLPDGTIRLVPIHPQSPPNVPADDEQVIVF